MKNNSKKVLKMMLKAFIVLLIIYTIYVISNIVYANYAIDKVVNAVYEEDMSFLEKYKGDSINAIIWNAQNNNSNKNIKNVNLQKIDTINVSAFLGKVIFKYQLEMADLENLIAEGKHTKNLIENFDEIFIKERQLQKIVKKNTGIYNTDLEHIGINEYSREFGIDEETFYKLIEDAILADENEYVGNKLSKNEFEIHYNIFTHEFERIDYIHNMKSGKNLRMDTRIYYNNELLYNENYLKESMLLINMFKKDEKPINIFSLNGKFVSLFEDAEENEINELEKFFIDNNYSMEQVENYLLNEGYVYGEYLSFINEENDTIIDVVFDGEILIYMYGYTESEKEDLDSAIEYFMKNNLSKSEIIDELQKEGYYIN